MNEQAFLIATEGLTSVLKHQPAAVIVGVVLDDGTGFVLHAHYPPTNKRDLDWLMAELRKGQLDGWPGEFMRVGE